jgi:hypothetical protein
MKSEVNIVLGDLNKSQNAIIQETILWQILNKSKDAIVKETILCPQRLTHVNF